MDLKSIIDKKDEIAKWIANDITHVCKTFEKRSPGTRGEEQACEYYAQMAKELGCDSAVVEAFEENPGSFYGWIYYSVSLTLASIPAYFVAPALTVGLNAASLGIALAQFGAYIKLMDPLFPKKTGHNMTAIKKPKGEVKRRIIFNGHPDAAWEWPVNYKLGGVGFEGHAILGFSAIFYYTILGLLRWKKEGAFVKVADAGLKKAGLYGLPFVPFLIGLYWLWNENRIVDGANDNLTGCEMGMAVLKSLKDEGIELENTEIGVILSGSEEAGLRGAKAWCEAHKGEFDDVPTFIYSYDTIHDPKYLMVNYRDLNGTVKADKDVSDLFYESAKELGIPCKKGWVPPLGGATDSAAFAQGGFRVTGITGLNHKLESYYHTRKDSYDNLNEEGIANCFAVTMKVLEKFDKGEKQ